MTADPGTDQRDPGPQARPVPPGARVRRVRWGAVAGAVVLVYVLVYAAALSQLASRDRFNRWGAAMGSLGARLVLCGVVLATLFHTFDGLRRMLPDVVPSLVDQDRRLRAAALFATWALALPSFAMIVWPWVSETTR
jgi:succinate dehydrogenase/fumarate reductase cytochrome b subunit